MPENKDSFASSGAGLLIDLPLPNAPTKRAPGRIRKMFSGLGLLFLVVVEALFSNRQEDDAEITGHYGPEEERHE